MRLIASITLLTTLAGLASAQTLLNGTFATDANGWTSDVAGGGWQGGSGSDVVPGYFWINSSGGADVPSIQQSITGLLPGDYEVSGFYRTIAIFNPGDPFRVLIDGVLKYSDNTARNAWTPFSFQFTTANPSALLRFEAEVTADSDWAIDTISVKAVPTPGAIGLLGFGGLLITRRRR